MNVKVEDLMVKNVVTSVPHKSLGHIKGVMETNKINSVPIVDSDNVPVGIITSSDFTKGHDENSPVSKIINEKVYTVPAYNDVHVAARIMRNHKIHHVVVTDNKEVVGVLSSFDLLKLVEDHRFVMKNAPTESKKGHKRK